MKKAAILGFGVVGGGTAEVLVNGREHIAASLGQALELKYILARRDYPDSPFRDMIVKDIGAIVSDPEIFVVAECIGGVGDAYDYVKRCLAAGKHIVTSNKQLVAEHGAELLAMAAERGLCFLFEASVGGGIPIIRPLLSCLAANRIDCVCGIINGTTNYILTQMLQCGQSYEAALAEAQRLGYAEADPTADVDGIDACRKISILADICFGKNVDPDTVPTEGIRSVTADDARFALENGYSVKLLGRAERLPDGSVCAFVAPHLVPAESMLANISDVMNGISVTGDAVGQCLFYGAGAGKGPTASAVVADMMDCVRSETGGRYAMWSAGSQTMSDPDELPMSFYVRFSGSCGTSAMRQCSHEDEYCMAISEKMTKKELLEKLEGARVLSLMPVLD